MQEASSDGVRLSWRTTLLRALLCGLLLLVVPCAARADLAFGQISVTFNDPGGTYSAYYADITSHTIAAAQSWASTRNRFWATTSACRRRRSSHCGKKALCDREEET